VISDSDVSRTVAIAERNLSAPQSPRQGGGAAGHAAANQVDPNIGTGWLVLITWSFPQGLRAYAGTKAVTPQADDPPTESLPTRPKLFGRRRLRADRRDKLMSYRQRDRSLHRTSTFFDAD
jgi:hypothetical protein